jgi:hypothetical protein
MFKYLVPGSQSYLSPLTSHKYYKNSWFKKISVWEGLGGVALLEGVYHWGGGVRCGVGAKLGSVIHMALAFLKETWVKGLWNLPP